MTRLALACLCVLLGACGAPGPAPTGPSEPQAAPTAALPMASLTPSLAAAMIAVQQGAGAAGFRVEHVVQPLRTGEPSSLQLVPRALLQVRLADPDDGRIVVYDLATPDRAAQAARDYVAYLQSGFGQTNFPADAQFAVNQIGSTVMFTWFAPEQSAEPERARAAFDALRLVGQSFPIVR